MYIPAFNYGVFAREGGGIPVDNAFVELFYFMCSYGVTAHVGVCVCVCVCVRLWSMWIGNIRKNTHLWTGVNTRIGNIPNCKVPVESRNCKLSMVEERPHFYKQI